MNVRPIIALLILAPLLPELTTGSTPIQSLFNPFILFLIFIGYSLPVLFIRELFVRWKLGFTGMLTVGFAYGILNEGTLTQTFLRVAASPMPWYNGYGFLGVNTIFAFVLSIWHALHSVIFPIMIVHYLYPGFAGKPWLGKKKSWLLLIPAVVMGIGQANTTGTQPYLVVFYITIIALLFVARTMPKATEKATERFSAKTAGLGILFLLVHLWGSNALGAARVSEVIIFAYAIVTLFVFVAILKRKGWTQPPNIIGFAVGSYIVVSAFGAFLSMLFFGNVVQVFAEIVVIIALLFWLVKIRKNQG